jgi:hypothetical protein
MALSSDVGILGIDGEPRLEVRAEGIGRAGTKKPGAVSRPGTLREFQFHE